MSEMNSHMQLDAHGFEEIVSAFEAFTRNSVSEQEVVSFLEAQTLLPKDVYDLFLGRYWLASGLTDSQYFYKAKNHLDTYLERIEGVEINDYPTETYLPQAISNAYAFAGMLYANLGDKELALKYYKGHHYMDVQWGVSPEDIMGVRLFSFRRFSQHSLSDLINNEITVCRPQKMNDPFDSIYTLWVEHYDEFCKEKNHVDPFTNSFDYFRIRSFVKDSMRKHPYNNILMWSHYADEHKGFCVEYHFSNKFVFSSLNNKIAMRFHSINYTDKTVVLDNRLTSVVGFYTKQKCWEYENEERLLTYIPGIESDIAHVPLDENSYIRSVYFGFRCPRNDRETIMRILGTGVMYYQMRHSLSDVYRLTPDQLI